MVLLVKRLFSLVLLPLFVVSVFAAESEDSVQDVPYVPYSFQQVYVLPDDSYIVNPQEMEPTEVEVSAYAMDPITPSNSNGLKAILLDILGNYSAIQVEMRYTNTNGTYSYVREIQPDYVWMASAFLFIVMVWCVFKLGGAILCKK